MRVLVIDDEADYRYLLSVGLGLLGHEVVEAAGPEQAVELVGPFDPEVILIDLVMMGGGGLGLLPRLRRASPRAALVLHTVEREKVLPVIGHPAGPDGLLEKGMAPADLAEALTGIVAVHQARTEASGGERDSAHYR